MEIFLGAGGGLGLALWAFKVWVNRVNKRFDKQDFALEMIKNLMTDIRIQLAKQEGESEGKEKLIWREINTDKNRLQKVDAKIDALWPLVQKMAEKIGLPHKRVSDIDD